MSNTITPQKNTSKKFKAILAGGVVLGVGAAVTLAAWTDQQWATADFSSGSFTLESSTSTVLDDESFDSNSSPGKLDFEMPQVSQLGPNEQVAAPFSIRLDEKTTHDAAVKMQANVGGQTKGLSYEAIEVDTPEQCATNLISVTSTDLGKVPATFPEKIMLQAGDKAKAGKPHTLCFIVTAGDDLPQNQAASAGWDFVAESVVAED